jgi:hypothetical protein
MPCKAEAPIGLIVANCFCFGEKDEAESEIILSADEDLDKSQN